MQNNLLRDSLEFTVEKFGYPDILQRIYALRRYFVDKLLWPTWLQEIGPSALMFGESGFGN